VNPADDGRNSTAALSSLTIRFGLWALLAYLTLGLALEALHGFKVAWYLEFETRRLLWTLAHAHGVLVSVLTIGFGLMLARTGDAAPWQRAVAGCLMAALVLLPGGFLLGGIFIYGGDPGPGVLLSPIGGALLFAAVLLAAIRYRPGQH
jgi:hypothetical protein